MESVTLLGSHFHYHLLITSTCYEAGVDWCQKSRSQRAGFCLGKKCKYLLDACELGSQTQVCDWSTPPLPLFPSHHGLLPPKLDDRVLVSVLLIIAEGGRKQYATISPDYDVLSCSCLQIPSLAFGRAALV